MNTPVEEYVVKDVEVPFQICIVVRLCTIQGPLHLCIGSALLAVKWLAGPSFARVVDKCI